MNVVLRGMPKEIVEKMITVGYASTQSEAIRLAIFWFGKEHLNEDELAAKKMDKIYKDYKEGKLKTYSMKEYAKKHPEFKELV